ncbi:hypothetical protein M408DRAFT_332911, partial [Serendipita vermifera MAFF 305830]
MREEDNVNSNAGGIDGDNPLFVVAGVLDYDKEDVKRKWMPQGPNWATNEVTTGQMLAHRGRSKAGCERKLLDGA